MPEHLVAVRYHRQETGVGIENLFCIGRGVHLMSQKYDDDRSFRFQIMGLCDNSCLHRNWERVDLGQYLARLREDCERDRDSDYPSDLEVDEGVEVAIRAQPIGMKFYDYCCHRCFYAGYCLGTVHIHTTFDYDTSYVHRFSISLCDGSCRKTEVVRLPRRVNEHLVQFHARNLGEDPEGWEFLNENGWMF